MTEKTYCVSCGDQILSYDGPNATICHECVHEEVDGWKPDWTDV